MERVERYGGRQQRREKKGVRESAVAPEVAVADAEAEADDVEIGDDRAERSDYPDALQRAGTIKACSNTEGSYRMGED